MLSAASSHFFDIAREPTEFRDDERVEGALCAVPQ
jgi:hypothetical protein